MTEPSPEHLRLEDMPHFMALIYARLQEVSNKQEFVQQACKLYDLGVRMLVITMLSQYLVEDRDSITDPYLNEILLQKLPRLTRDAWQQLLFTSLEVYEGQHERLYLPELYTYYWDVKPDGPRPRPELKALYDRLSQIATEVEERRYLPHDELAWARLADEIKGLLQQFLAGLAFLADYELIRVVGRTGAGYTYELHRGSQVHVVSDARPRPAEFEMGWFYLRRRGAEAFLLLHPLLVFWEHELETGALRPQTDTGVYNRFIYEKSLQYRLVANDELVSVSAWAMMFIKMLYDTIEDAKHAKAETTKLSWWQARNIIQDITDTRMKAATGRFVSELYTARLEARSAIDSFLASDRRGFVMTGMSGIGKSSFLLALAAELHTEHADVGVLIYEAGQLSTELTLTEEISRDFERRVAFRGRPVGEVWRELADIDDIHQRKVLLCIDALNEHAQPKQLLRELNGLLLHPYTWLKIVITSRPEAWQEITRGVSLAEGLYYRDRVTSPDGDGEPFTDSYEMRPFTTDELNAAYEKYRLAYGLTTRYDELSEEVRAFLQEPLNLWLVAKTYRMGAIPKGLLAAELVEGYIGAELRSGRLAEEGLRLLERDLVPLLLHAGRYTNAFTPADVDAIAPELFNRIYSEQILGDGRPVNHSFVQLLSAEILMRQGIGRSQQIGFKHERFYEYFVGNRLSEDSRQAEDAGVFYRSMVGQIEETPFLWGAMRRALYQDLSDPARRPIVQALLQENDRQLAHIVTSALIQYAARDPSTVRVLLLALLKARRTAPVTQDAILKVALHTLDREVLRQALTSPREQVRSRAVGYMYELYRTHPDVCLSVIDALGQQLRHGWLPNIPVFRTVTILAGTILMEIVHDPFYREPSLETIRRLVKRMMYAESQNQRGKMAREITIRLVFDTFFRLMKGLRRFEIAPGVADWENIFALTGPQRQPLVDLISYLDYRHGTIEGIDALLLPVRSLRNHMANQILFSVINIRGSLDPDSILPVILKLYASDFGHNCERLDAIYNWEICVTYQGQLQQRWLQVQRELVLALFDDPRVESGQMPELELFGGFRAYPLMAYASIWNRLHPGQEVDLIQEILARAQKTDNRALMLHIIDGFGDSRFRLVDYRAPLRSLTRFVSSNDIEMQAHLVETLARLDSIFPEQVAHILFEASAPRLFCEMVHERSHDETITTMFRRVNFFFRDAMLRLSSENAQEVVRVLREAAREPTFSRALQVALKSLVNELGGGNLFAPVNGSSA